MNASPCPSYRYVAPDGAPIVRNLAALWAIDPGVALLVESVDDTRLYKISPSRSGAPTVCVDSRDNSEAGQSIWMHSRYDPRDEARQLIDDAISESSAAFYVHGFGLGYHVQDLFERTGKESLICVFEPDICMLRTALETIDYSSMLLSRRVHFFVDADKSAFFSRLHPMSPLLTMGFVPVRHAPSMQRCRAEHETYAAWVADFLAYAKTTMNTLVLNGRRTCENLARNIPWYVATPSLQRLHNCHAKTPAIIVAAGPSLRRNKHLLSHAQGKSVIIAVQTALQPVLEEGIEPDFVTSLDYHDICTRFFENLPANLRTELVAEPKATSAIFGMNPGPLSMLGNDFIEQLLAELRLNKTKLPSGATVAHLAFYLAEHMGCDPIIFVGQDLGFTDHLSHTPGTSYDNVWQPEFGAFCTPEMKQWEQIVRERPIMRRVPDQAGGAIYTEERLFTYLQHFERDFARASATIIDATEGGARKRGTIEMPLAEAIRKFCTRERATRTPRHGGLDWRRLQAARDSLLRRADEAAQIRAVSVQTLPLLREIDSEIEDQPRVNRAIARIDELRGRLSSLMPTYQAVMQLSQQSELERFRADQRISAAGLTGIQKQRSQVQRDIANVTAVVDACDAFARLMDEAIARIDEFSIRQGIAA